MPGWPLRAGVRSGCVPRGLNKSSSVDPEPSLGVRPNMQTRFAPKVEKTLGHCRKPHMGTGALRARKAAHRRVTPVGLVPSVHNGYADMVCGAGPRSGGLGVRIVISPDTSCIVYDTLDVETVTRVEVALRRRGTRRSSAAVGGWRQPVFRAHGRQRQLVDRWLASRNCQNGTARQAGSGSVSIGGQARPEARFFWAGSHETRCIVRTLGCRFLNENADRSQQRASAQSTLAGQSARVHGREAADG